MGEIRNPRPAKLFAALLVRGGEMFPTLEAALCERFGPIELRSADFPFRYTDYYAREMGENLNKRLVAFAGLFDSQKLADAKIASNEIEARFVQGGRRLANADPGFLSESKIVLASTKDNAQRIPIGSGIFAEITMTFDAKLGDYAALRWTYPDYASGDFRAFFLELRERYRGELKKLPLG